MTNVLDFCNYKHLKIYYGKNARKQFDKWNNYFSYEVSRELKKMVNKESKFQVKVVDDLLNGGKVFRLFYGDSIIGLGSMKTLKEMDDETIGVYLTEVLNCALTFLHNQEKRNGK